MVVERGDLANLVCNECAAVVRTVARKELDLVLAEMSLADGFVPEICPYCGSVNLFAGFTKMEAYVCRQCGKGVAKS